MLIEFTLFEFLLSNGKISDRMTILIIVKFFFMESLVYFEILTARNAWVL